MIRNTLIILFCLLCSVQLCGQTWETVKSDKQYLWGEGRGSSIEEAKQQAVADLIGKISLYVTSENNTQNSHRISNGALDETSQFSQSVNTYSQATLNNTELVIIENEPNAHVGLYIKRNEIAKIFEARQRRILDMVETALRAEQKGEAGNALRNYSWALALLKSLQYPNDVTYTDGEGNSHVLTNWVKEQMEGVFAELKVNTVKRSEDDVELSITYKGKPVGNVDYTFFDGRQWSNLYSAKDGRGMLELSPGNSSKQYQIKFEYEYRGEAVCDPELASVLKAVKGTSMKSAYVSIDALPATSSNDPKIVNSVTTRNVGSTFTSNDTEIIKEPTLISEPSDKYITIFENISQSVRTSKIVEVRKYFTEIGWEAFSGLLKYGKVKVLDSPEIKFYKYEQYVMARGLKMAFSFARGVKKSFVEDLVFLFDTDGKICNVTFGLGDTAESDILFKGPWKENTRMAIMNFLENYKTAYALKRLEYIRGLFDDNAVIITAVVSNKAPMTLKDGNKSMSVKGQKTIRYNRQTKDEYLRNLARCFNNNEFVNIRFSDNDVIKCGAEGEVYSIQIGQDYYSTNYGDKGYLFLMVDINNPEQPIIKVRTWQPEKDPNFGLYGAGDF